MAKRPGPGLSAKLIMTATLFAVLMVVCFGVMAVLNIRAGHDAAAVPEAGAPGLGAHEPEAASEERRRSAEKAAVARTIALGAFFVLLGGALAAVYGRSLTRSLRALARHAEQIAHGQLDARVPVRSADELGALGARVNALAETIEAAERKGQQDARREDEREIARVVQERLVPPNELVDRGCFSLAGYFQPAARFGGDWWMHRTLGKDRLVLVVGSVGGRGPAAALVAAAARASCDTACAAGPALAVEELLSLMNGAIYQSTRRALVMTCFASIIDLDARVITYANAGHKFPYLYRVGDEGRDEFGSLMSRGNRLGELKESIYESKSTQLRPGDTLIWYTGGVVARENEQGEVYGEKRFRTSIRRAAHLGAGDLRNTVVSEARSFCGKARRRHDVTVIVGRVA